MSDDGVLSREEFEELRRRDVDFCDCYDDYEHYLRVEACFA